MTRKFTGPGRYGNRNVAKEVAKTKKESLAEKTEDIAKLKVAVKKINKTIHPLNYKYIVFSTTTVTNSLTNAAPVSVLINGVDQGTDETQRIGDICQMKYLDMYVNLYGSNLTNLPPQQVRVVLVWEGKSALGSLASFGGVFDSSTPSPTANRNMTTRNPGRYKILYDRTHFIGQVYDGSTTVGTNTLNNHGAVSDKIIHIKKNLDGLVTDYSRGSTAAVTSIDTGILTLMVFTDNSTASALGVAYGYTLKFLDS